MRAAKQYGTHHFHDHRVDEVLDLQPIVVWLDQQPVEVAIEVMQSVATDPQIDGLGDKVVERIILHMSHNPNNSDQRLDKMAENPVLANLF